MKSSSQPQICWFIILLLQFYVENSNGDPATVAAVASAVVAGASLAQTSVQSLVESSATWRAVAINIENYHNDLELVGPSWYHDSGTDQIPPSPVISPGYKEACLFRKVSGTLTGACGLLRYRIDQVTKRDSTIIRNMAYETAYIFIMYCSPYSGDTSFAVDLRPTFDEVDYEYFNYLYTKNSKPGGTSSEIRTTMLGTRIHIISTMSNASKAVLTVRIQ